MNENIDTFDLFFGKETNEKLDKAKIELDKLEEKYKEMLGENDQLSFYYVTHYNPIRLRWVKDGLPDYIKKEIIDVMDKFFPVEK